VRQVTLNARAALALGLCLASTVCFAQGIPRGHYASSTGFRVEFESDKSLVWGNFGVGKYFPCVAAGADLCFTGPTFECSYQINWDESNNFSLSLVSARAADYCPAGYFIKRARP